MEEYILRRQVWLRFLISLPFIVFVAAVSLFGLYITYVFLTWAFGEVFDWLHFFVSILILPFAILFAVLCFMLVQDSFSQVVFSSKGIEQKRFGKCVCFLPWDELAETGITLVNGNKEFSRYLYFADWHLDEIKRSFINATIYGAENSQSGKLIIVDCAGIQNEGILRRICPVPIPSTRKPQDIMKDLISYRRDRNEDGLWTESKMTVIPDARKIGHDYRILQRENNRRRRH